MSDGRPVSPVEAYTVAPDTQLGSRVTALETEVKTLAGSVRDWIGESRESRRAFQEVQASQAAHHAEQLRDVHSRITHQGKPQYGLILTALALAFTIIAGYVGTISFFYADKQGDHGKRIDANTAEIISTGRTRFTAEDGKELQDLVTTNVTSLREEWHHHQATEGHPAAIERLDDHDAALTHRRDEADKKFTSVEARYDALAVKVARIEGILDLHVHKE